ncbi:MAG: hypothetical protein RMM17_00905 [Acidobacteriota bacterium]|nr:hypothetical protein [Blastocatellia bacterium]MDW8411226.1 hypothetical protein [Acidobacteriota bacterium]
MKKMITASCFLALALSVGGQELDAKKFFRPVPTASSAVELADIEALYKAVEVQKQLELGEAFLAKYPESSLRGIAYRYVVASLVQLKQSGRAIEVAMKALAERKDNLSVMAEICRMGSEEARNKVFTNSTVALEMGTRALAMVDVGTIPYEYSDADWNARRESFVGSLHKALGTIYFYQEKWADAARHFLSASQMLPTDPYSYYMNAKSRYNEAYQKRKPIPAEEIVGMLAKAYVLTDNDTYRWLQSTVDMELKYVAAQSKLASPLDSYIQAARDQAVVNASAPMPAASQKH